MALIFADPAIVNFLQRQRIKIVQFLAPAPDRRNEVSSFKKREMLRHRLSGHGQVFAKLAQGLAVGYVQLVEKFPAARIGKRLEHVIHLDR